MSPNSSSSTSPRLERSAVCFLDVLGTQSLMAGDDADKNLRGLKAAIDGAADRFLSDEQDMPKGFRAIWFTDNILLTWPWPNPGDDGEMELGFMLNVAGWFMLEMALAGYFVRGGITVGDVYTDPRFAFGPALVEAVEIEKQVAVHPRVALSHDAVVLAAAHSRFYAAASESPQGSSIVVDDDGVAFLNYLGSIEDEEDLQWRIDTLTAHRDRVVEALMTSTSVRVLDKYRWLARYHNHYCHKAFPGMADLVIDSSRLGLHFTSLGDVLT